MLPIVFLGFVNWRMGKKGVIIGVVLFFAILLFKNIVTSIIENTLSVTGLGKYTYYLEEGKEESKLESGIGFVYQIIIMSMILYYEKDKIERTD